MVVDCIATGTAELPALDLEAEIDRLAARRAQGHNYKRSDLMNQKTTEESNERFLHVYCDESRQTADRYMVIGGLITLRENEIRFTQAMMLYRQSQRMRAELKWTKVSDQKLAEYRALIDLFFSINRALHFKAIVVDTQEIDNRRYNQNDAELGFYKPMYQFLLHNLGHYLEPSDRCIVFLDQRRYCQMLWIANHQAAILSVTKATLLAGCA